MKRYIQQLRYNSVYTIRTQSHRMAMYQKPQKYITKARQLYCQRILGDSIDKQLKQYENRNTWIDESINNIHNEKRIRSEENNDKMTKTMINKIHQIQAYTQAFQKEKARSSYWTPTKIVDFCKKMYIDHIETQNQIVHGYMTQTQNYHASTPKNVSQSNKAEAEQQQSLNGKNETTKNNHQNDTTNDQQRIEENNGEGTRVFEPLTMKEIEATTTNSDHANSSKKSSKVKKQDGMFGDNNLSKLTFSPPPTRYGHQASSPSMSTTAKVTTTRDILKQQQAQLKKQKAEEEKENDSIAHSYSKEQLRDMREQINQLKYIGEGRRSPDTVPVNYDILNPKSSSKFLISTNHLAKLSALESRYDEFFMRKSFEDMSLDFFEKTIVFLGATLPDMFVSLLNRFILKVESLIVNPVIMKEWAVRVKDVVVEEAKHFAAGGKQFGRDVASAFHLVIRAIAGHEMSWREKRMLKRTISDIFRIVPFSMFIIIPAAEVLLPFALKMFPGMLPSQFKSTPIRQESKKKQRAKLRLAEFLQNSVGVVVEHGSKKIEDEGTRQELLDFVDRLKSPHHRVSNSDLIRFSRYFSDTMALDNAPRSHLVAMCTILNLPTFGSNGYLRYSLRKQLRRLRAEDKDIYFQGINSLTMEELVIACSERAMKTGVSKKQLRYQLSEWIQLSLDFNIPPSLLVISRAFHLTIRDDVLFEVLSKEDEEAMQQLKLEQKQDDAQENFKREQLRNSLISLSHSEDEKMLQHIIEEIHNMPLHDAAAIIGEIDANLSSHVRSTLAEATKDLAQQQLLSSSTQTTLFSSQLSKELEHVDASHVLHIPSPAREHVKHHVHKRHDGDASSSRRDS